MSQDPSKDGRSLLLMSSIRQSLQSFLLPKSPARLMKTNSSRSELYSTESFSVKPPQSSETTESFKVSVPETSAPIKSASPTSETKKEDFADSETSQEPILSAAEVDAETIYSIIQDYDLTHEFLFNEDFNSTTESGTIENAKVEDTRQGPSTVRENKNSAPHDTTLFSNVSNLESAANSPIKFVTVSRSEMPSLVNMQKSSLQILSSNKAITGDSEAKLVLASLVENLTIGLPSATRVSITTPMQPEFSTISSQRVSLTNLLEEYKSSSSHGLKSTEHIPSPSSLSSTHQSTKFLRDTIDDRDFSEVFSSLSFGTIDNTFPYETRLSRTELLSMSHEYGVSVPETLTPTKCFRIPILGANQPCYSPTVPEAFPTRDSMEKLRLHRRMFSDFSQESLESQILPAIIHSWTKWGFMMVTALVVVPVFFLLALGMLDKKGFYYHDFNTPNEKATINLRYHQRYSTRQKLASFVLGIFWVAIILSMIGVGFGLGLTRIPS